MLCAKSQQGKMVGCIYRKQATALEAERDSWSPVAGSDCWSPGVSLGEDAKALYTHHHAAQLCKYMEDCAPYALNSEYYV